VPYDLDPACDKARCRKIELAGREFFIAPLPLRQVLAVSDLMPRLSGITAQNFGRDNVDAVIDLLWYGLLKAHPHLTKDDLLDLPITLADLMNVVPVVLEQAGGKRADPAGEAQATSGSTQLTGASSSPTS